MHVSNKVAAFVPRNDRKVLEIVIPHNLAQKLGNFMNQTATATRRVNVRFLSSTLDRVSESSCDSDCNSSGIERKRSERDRGENQKNWSMKRKKHAKNKDKEKDEPSNTREIRSGLDSPSDSALDKTRESVPIKNKHRKEKDQRLRKGKNARSEDEKDPDGISESAVEETGQEENMSKIRKIWLGLSAKKERTEAVDNTEKVDKEEKKLVRRRSLLSFTRESDPEKQKENMSQEDPTSTDACKKQTVDQTTENMPEKPKKEDKSSNVNSSTEVAVAYEQKQKDHRVATSKGENVKGKMSKNLNSSNTDSKINSCIDKKYEQENFHMENTCTQNEDKEDVGIKNGLKGHKEQTQDYLKERIKWKENSDGTMPSDHTKTSEAQDGCKANAGSDSFLDFAKQAPAIKDLRALEEVSIRPSRIQLKPLDHPLSPAHKPESKNRLEYKKHSETFAEDHSTSKTKSYFSAVGNSIGEAVQGTRLRESNDENELEPKTPYTLSPIANERKRKKRNSHSNKVRNREKEASHSDRMKRMYHSDEESRTSNRSIHRHKSERVTNESSKIGNPDRALDRHSGSSIDGTTKRKKRHSRDRDSDEQHPFHALNHRRSPRHLAEDSQTFEEEFDFLPPPILPITPEMKKNSKNIEGFGMLQDSAKHSINQITKSLHHYSPKHRNTAIAIMSPAHPQSRHAKSDQADRKSRHSEADTSNRERLHHKHHHKHEIHEPVKFRGEFTKSRMMGPEMPEFIFMNSPSPLPDPIDQSNAYHAHSLPALQTGINPSSEFVPLENANLSEGPKQSVISNVSVQQEAATMLPASRLAYEFAIVMNYGSVNVGTGDYDGKSLDEILNVVESLLRADIEVIFLRATEITRHKACFVLRVSEKALVQEAMNLKLEDWLEQGAMGDVPRIEDVKAADLKSADRIQVFARILEREDGPNLSVNFKDKRKFVDAVFPLHDPELNRVMSKRWNAAKSQSDEEILINELRDIFGEEVAYFFSFMSHYKRHLIPPTVFGVVLWVILRWAHYSLYMITLAIFGYLMAIVWAPMLVKTWNVCL